MRDRIFLAYQRGRHQSPLLRKAVGILPGARQLHRAAYRRLRPTEVSVDSNGFSVLVDPRDEVIGAALICGRQWEPYETGLFERTIRPGSLVADVGANIGLYTLAAARASQPSGRVVAFEPDPRIAALLRGNVARNGLHERVTVLERAVTDASGTEVRLFRDDSNLGSHSLGAANVRLSGWIDVPGTTLTDALCEQGIERLDVLKLDVQGAEARVIAGARPLLRETRTVFMEFWPRGLRSLDADPAELLHTLCQDLGFRCSWIDQEKGRLVELPGIQDTVSLAEELDHIDLLCLRE